MLVLKRKEKDWTEVTSRSGDVLRIRTQNIQAAPGQTRRVDLVFDDPDRNFEIRRPERRVLLPGASVVDTADELTPVSTPGPEADRGFEPVAAAELPDFDPFTFRLEGVESGCPASPVAFACPADDDLDPGDQAVS